MSRLECQARCGRPAGSGFICSYCLAQLTKSLQEIPGLLADLDLVITRQTNSAIRYGGRSASSPLPFHSAAAEVRTNVLRHLDQWAAQLVDQDSPSSPDPRSVIEWMLLQATRLRTWPKVGQLAVDIQHDVDRIEWLRDRPPSKWILGPCANCGRTLYAETDARSVVCLRCNTLVDVVDRRSFLIESARAVCVPAAVCCRAVSWMDGRVITPQRLAGWVRRGKLKPAGFEPYKGTDKLRPLYRIGDVLDAFLAELDRPC